MPRCSGAVLRCQRCERGRVALLGCVRLLATAARRRRIIKFDVRAAAELLATVDAQSASAAPGTSRGREAVDAARSRRRPVFQHLPLVRSGRADYRVLLGAVAPGSHTRPRRSRRERDARATCAAAARTSSKRRGLSRSTEPRRYPPLRSRRSSTRGRIPSDASPMCRCSCGTRSSRQPRGTRYRYSVIFTNEDGGTPADRLMATWGRTTDIEYVYSVEVDRDGRDPRRGHAGPGARDPAVPGQARRAASAACG